MKSGGRTVIFANTNVVHKNRRDFPIEAEIFGSHPEILFNNAFFAEKFRRRFGCDFCKVAVVYKRRGIMEETAFGGAAMGSRNGF